MALLQNITIWAQYPHTRHGGSTASGTDGHLARSIRGIKNTTQLMPFAGGFDKTNSFPTGWQFGNGWLIRLSDGGAWQANLGDVATPITTTLGSLNVASGRNLAGDTTITFTLPDAQLQLVVSASGAVTVTWTVEGNVAGALWAEGTTTGTFTLGTPTLGAIADLTGPVSVTVSLAALLRATGALAGDITPFTELSPQSLAEAVRDVVIESPYTLAEVLRLLVAVAAGQDTVTDLVGGQTEVAFRDLADSKDRIVATLDGEERTAVTLDAT